MTAFRYRVLDRSGRALQGVLEADSARLARASLRERGYLPVLVESVQPHHRLGGALFGRSLPASELVLLTQQLSTLINAGLPLEQALSAVTEQTEHDTSRLILAALRSEILQGQSFAQALATQAKVFSPLYCALVASGEQSGRLSSVMARLAEYLERKDRSRQKVRQALAYPVVVMFVALLVVAGLMSYVVPQIVGVFIQTKQSLPWLTRVLLQLSQFLREWGWALFFAIALSFFGLRYLFKRPAWRRALHSRLLKVPILGRLLRALNTAQMSGTLSILVGSGVPLLYALSTVRGLLTLLPLQDALVDAIERVREGHSLAGALAHSKQFPPVLVHLIGSGEKSGTLAMMLERAAAQQQEEVDRRLGTFTVLIEPCMILLMGGIVMIIVLAIMLPIIEMNQMIR